MLPFYLSQANSFPIGICSDYTLFQAAIIKSTDVSQNILLDPLEEHPERHIHNWNVSNPTRWLIHDVPPTWKEGDQHKVVLDGNSSSEQAGSPSLLGSLEQGDRVAVMVRGLVSWLRRECGKWTDVSDRFLDG